MCEHTLARSPNGCRMEDRTCTVNGADEEIMKHNLLGQRDRQNSSSSAASQLQRGERNGGQHGYHRSMCLGNDRLLQ